MTTYEGWSNFETRSCSLWLNQEYYQEKKQWIAEARQSDDPVKYLADKFGELLLFNIPDFPRHQDIYRVLLTNAIEQIDLIEIAKDELQQFPVNVNANVKATP